MQGSAQIVGGVLRIEIRPEDVEQVLAMQPMPRLQRQQFDDGCRASLPPDRRGNLLLRLRSGRYSSRTPRSA